jgi:hypothetical protein
MSLPSLRISTPPCLPLDIKDLLKEDARLLPLLWGFCLRLLLLAFGLLTFGCGRLLEGKRIAEGKRLEGKRLLKRKRIAKGNC